jgi:hypothetical protein
MQSMEKQPLPKALAVPSVEREPGTTLAPAGRPITDDGGSLPSRRPYVPPRLLEFGHVHELTQGIHSVRNDAGGGFVLTGS